VRIERRFFRHLFLLGPVDPADGIRLHLRQLERHGDPALAFAEVLLVGAAHEGAFDVDVVAFRQLCRGVFAETLPSDNSVPLRLGVSFFVCILPGSLSRERQNRVFAIRRSNGLLLRVLAEITDEMNSVLVHFVSPFLPLELGHTESERMLLPKRASAFWEGHEKSSAEFRKICWEEPEKQKTRSCRAQELSRSSAQWRG
jgi:hypothetical protein